MPLLIQFLRKCWEGKRPVCFVVLYVAFSCAWFRATDILLNDLSSSGGIPRQWNLIRRLLYLAVASGIIYWFLRRLAQVNNHLEELVASRTAALGASEAEVTKREEGLRRLINSLPDVTWTTSEDLQTVFVSPNVESLLGYSVEEVYCDGAVLLRKGVAPEDWQQLSSAYQALFSDGRPFDVEFRAQRKDGRWIWLHNHATRVHAENGTRFADGSMSDITVRKDAELAREESDRRYRHLFEKNLAGVFRAQLGGKFLDCNPAFFQMLGYDSAVELLDCTAEDILYDPSDVDSLKGDLATYGVVRSTEVRLKRKDGSLLWALHNVGLLQAEPGSPLCIQGTVVNISKRKQAEEALAKQLTLMQTITSAAPDGLFMLDAQGRVTFMNPAAERIFGFTAAELQGKVLHDTCHSKRSDGTPLSRSDCELAVAMACGKPMFQCEEVNFRKDGKPFHSSSSSAPLLDNGKLIGSVLVVHDISARKETEEQYRSLHEQFLHAQKMEAIGRLAGGVAHDFNNLLQIINGYSSLIVDHSGASPEIKKKARDIQEAGSRAAQLTKQLLDFSRKESSSPQATWISSAVDEAMNMLRTLVGTGVELTIHHQIDGECVKIDPGQLQQLLLNLVVNARDAMPRGGKLHIETSRVQLDERTGKAFGNVWPGTYILISVSDSGCGMDAITRSRALEPFFTTKERGKGTGLGLSTVYGIVTQNGGGIQIKSKPGQGTTFRICLPISEPAVANTPAPQSRPVGGGGESILVAEDEEIVGSLICGHLEQLGYKVVQAANGIDALRIAKDSSPSLDLLITDMIMPKMGGEDLSNRILLLCPTLKVIQMSGYHETPYPKAVSIAHLEKPFSLDALATTVRHSLDS